jgi:predicted transcriptional regulator
MEDRFQTLQTLYSIVQESSNLMGYQCTPRELILRSSFDWSIIQKHLELLEQEEMIVITKAETVQYAITKSGIEKAASVESAPAKELTISFKEGSSTK